MKRQLDAFLARLDRRWLGWPGGVVAGLTLLAFALRLHDLGRWDLTFDESASIWIARKPPLDMIRYLLGAFHEHPPFYYLSLWAWTQAAGASEYALRFWSVLAGVLSVPLLYVWLRRLAGRAAGLAAAALLTLSPLHIYYSQDARMYPLIGALALLSLIFFGRILKDGRRRWWIAWGGVTLAGLASHYFMGLVSLVETAYLLATWRQNRRALKTWLWLHASLAALLGLWILASPGLQTTLAGLLSLGGRAEPILKTLRVLAFDIEFGPVSRLGHEWLWAMLLLAASGIGAAIGQRADRERANAGWLIAALIVVPPALVLLTPEALASRYVLFVVFGYVGAIALAAVQLGRRVPLAGMAVLLIAAWTGVSRYEHQYPWPKSVYGRQMAHIQSNWQPGDALILNGPWQWVQLDYYRSADLPTFFLPPQTPPALDPVAARPILESIAQDYRRIWVLQAAVDIADPDAFVLSWLNEHAFPADRRDDLWLYYTRKETVESVPLNIAFGDALLLRAAVVPRQPVASGDAALAGLSWSVQRAPHADLAASLALVGPDGSIWAERVYQPGELFAPARTWVDGQDIVDLQALLVPIGTPPGDYDLRLNVRRADSGSALMPASGDDAWLTVAQVQVDAPRPDAPAPGLAQNATYGDALRLVSAAPSGERFSQGGWIGVDLYWSPTRALPGGLRTGLLLVDGAGSVVAQADQPIAPETYPTSDWTVGQLVRSRHAIQIPPRAAAGPYRLQVGVLDAAGEVWMSAGSVKQEILFGLLDTESTVTSPAYTVADVWIDAIPREFALPSPQHAQEARFGDVIRLLGYDLEPDPVRAGEALQLTVYWQSLRATDVNYTVFTHVVGDDGASIGQSDHWPRNFTYPTSYWVEGEVVADAYAISLDPAARAGIYRLWLGWYDSATGDRLLAFGSDGQPLPDNQLLLTIIEAVEP